PGAGAGLSAPTCPDEVGPDGGHGGESGAGGLGARRRRVGFAEDEMTSPRLAPVRRTGADNIPCANRIRSHGIQPAPDLRTGAKRRTTAPYNKPVRHHPPEEL